MHHFAEIDAVTISSLEIDLGSADGADLMRAVSRVSPLLARAQRLLTRAFLLRSDWAPGFRLVGAQTSYRGFSFNVGGGGESIERAMMSCLGEAAERVSQVEQPGDTFHASDCDTVPISADARRLLDTLALNGHSAAVDWSVGHDLSGRPSRIPADWCLRRQHYGELRAPGTVMSTGCAAGIDEKDATVRALLELIERDAAALWWSGARRAAPVRAGPDVENMLQCLRGTESPRKTRLLDISSDIEIPVVAAVSCDANGQGLAIGLAARCTPKHAAIAALFELCQMELGLQLAQLKSSAGDRLTDDDERHLARAAIDIKLDERFTNTEPDELQKDLTEYDELATLVAVIDKHDIDATVVNLTRPDIGSATVKVVTPRLQPLPSHFSTSRLTDAVTDKALLWPPAIALH